jgi:hypothetical protein
MHIDMEKKPANRSHKSQSALTPNPENIYQENIYPTNYISEKAKDIVDMPKLESLETNPYSPKAVDITKKKYDLFSEDPIISYQMDILAKLKVLMDQSYAINDIRNFTQACNQASIIIRLMRDNVIEGAQSSNLDVEESIKAFNLRLKEMTGK